MIVGVDSGTWRAFAALDFNGNLAALKSRKNWLPEEFVRELSECSPTIIACDKNPAPRKVVLLKSVFGARLYKPSRSLTGLEKQNLINGFSVRNSHERDALASAVKAFKSVRNKLERIDKKTRDAGYSASRITLVKRMVLKGASVHSALTGESRALGVKGSV